MKEKENIVELSGFDRQAPDNASWDEKHYSLNLPLKVVKELKSVQSEGGVYGIVKEYLTSTKKGIEQDFEAMEEDVARYKGLMLGYKAKYKEALVEHEKSIYTLWEESEDRFNEVQKKISGKVKELSDQIKPLKAEFDQLNEISKEINKFDVEKLVSAINTISNLYGENKEMLKFLIENYGRANS